MSINLILQNGLIKLEMYDKEKPVDGLKLVSELENEKNPYIRFHLEDAKIYGATAVYFRHFENRPSIPQIYIYEEQKDINTLHKKLWSSCKVPMFFIFTKTEIKIFNSMSKKNINEQNIKSFIDIPIEDTIKITSEIQQKLNAFNAKKFDTGSFWNEDYNKEFSYKNSAYNSLLDSLENVRNTLISDKKLSISLVHSLLIKSMLIKYLEERDIFDATYWSKIKPNAKSFNDEKICGNKDSLNKLFIQLGKQFNGNVFNLKDSDKKELEDIDNKYLSKFKNSIQGNIDKKGQAHLWDLYSFKDLPVELISNIYELFLNKDENKGVVYTPSILVNFMIDEIMPLEKPKSSFKVIDPSCGSGIFLVGAYKRLIQWWKINNKWQTL